MKIGKLKIGIMGGGAWGLALAKTYTDHGSDVVVHTRDPDTLRTLKTGGVHPRVLTDVVLPQMHVSDDIAAFLHCDIICVAVRAQDLRSRLEALPDRLNPKVTLVLCCKGLETESLKFGHDIAHETCPDNAIAVFSGPSFASDVAKGLPTAVSIAAADIECAEHLATKLQTPIIRPYASDDVMGVEIGGSLKNVLAIACGMAEGLGLGQSAHAALLSRGFAELSRLGLALGARLDTLTGLSGLGDLVLTCGSTQSRNFRMGVALGQGQKPADILADLNEIAEGVYSSPSALALAQRQNIDMPIVAAVNAVLAGSSNAQDVVRNLLKRPLKRDGLS